MRYNRSAILLIFVNQGPFCAPEIHTSLYFMIIHFMLYQFFPQLPTNSLHYPLPSTYIQPRPSFSGVLTGLFVIILVSYFMGVLLFSCSDPLLGGGAVPPCPQNIPHYLCGVLTTCRTLLLGRGRCCFCQVPHTQLVPLLMQRSPAYTRLGSFLWKS